MSLHPATLGYKLGEHCDWFKHDNYEDSTRIVTIIKPAEGLIPDMRPRGSVCGGL
jgi:hypothetical protein